MRSLDGKTQTVLFGSGSSGKDLCICICRKNRPNDHRSGRSRAIAKYDQTVILFSIAVLSGLHFIPKTLQKTTPIRWGCISVRMSTTYRCALSPRFAQCRASTMRAGHPVWANNTIVCASRAGPPGLVPMCAREREREMASSGSAGRLLSASGRMCCCWVALEDELCGR